MGPRADILIIDDDRDLVNALRIILEKKDYTVRAAHNGKEGYAKIEGKIPDLIILDVMMATDTEGFDLAFKLRDNLQYRDIPIVMMTGFPQKMAEEGPERFQHIMGESWPVSHILEKPVDPEELVSIVQAFLKEAGKG
jgi:two-component system alkaline phosphatase synthesis response regulator PhoP